jgi:hypothetical protein
MCLGIKNIERILDFVELNQGSLLFFFFKKIKLVRQLSKKENEKENQQKNPFLFLVFAPNWGFTHLSSF